MCSPWAGPWRGVCPSEHGEGQGGAAPGDPAANQIVQLEGKFAPVQLMSMLCVPVTGM